MGKALSGKLSCPCERVLFILRENTYNLNIKFQFLEGWALKQECVVFIPAHIMKIGKLSLLYSQFCILHVNEKENV